jgi:hypothetical protein
MMRLFAAAVFSVSLFGSAFAADKPAPHCAPIAKFKAKFSDSKYHWQVLTPGQFHFSQGVYVGSPLTPEGLPPGDGALLLRHEGDEGALIIWTRDALACDPLPMPEKFIKLLAGIKTGAVDGDGSEL